MTKGSPTDAVRGGCARVSTSSGRSERAAATSADRERLSERQRLRGGELARDRAAVAFGDRDGDQARLLLEGHLEGVAAISELSGRRQREGRAHVRVARKGDLLRRREDAHTARVPGFGRQHEGALGEVELAGDLLHAPARETARVRQDGERIAPEETVGKDIDEDEPVAHAWVQARR